MIRRTPAIITDRRGSVLVEFAVILPLMILVIVGGIDIAMAMISRMELEFAVEATAKCFATGNANCPTTAAAASYAAALMPGASFTVSTMPCGGSVNADYTYTPIILPTTIELQARACYPT